MLIYPYDKGKELKKGKYVKSTPKKWSDEEVEWAYNKKEEGYTYKEIGEALDRTEVSVSIKVKRHTKKITHIIKTMLTENTKIISYSLKIFHLLNLY